MPVRPCVLLLLLLAATAIGATTPQFRRMKELAAIADDWEPALAAAWKRRWSGTVHFNSGPTTMGRIRRRLYNFSCGAGKLRSFWRRPTNNTHSLKKDQQHGGYIDQFLDHFSATDQRQFKQYFYHSAAGDGRVNFLYISGEETLASFRTNTAMETYRLWLNASVYHLEHRFYGASQPFKKYDVSNFAYLTIEQALADAAAFIRAINELRRSDPRSSKEPPIWIAFGGSYAGALAAWLRLKFPRLVHGAVASSATVQIVTDFLEFYDAVDRRIRKVGGSRCAQNIRSVFQDLAQRLSTSTGRAQLRIMDSRDAEYFVHRQIWTVAGASTSCAQIYALCARAHSYLRAVALNYNSASVLMGAFINSSTVKYRQSSVVHSNEIAWEWQRCTQFFGFPRLCEHRHTDFIFGDIPERDPKMECDEFFNRSSMYGNATLDDIVATMRRLYGGKQYRGTDVLFISGEEDAWYDLCINEQPPGVDRFQVILTGAGHCQDMGKPCDDADEDSLRLKSAHRELVRWLRELVRKNGGNE